MSAHNEDWWRGATIYQIYPRSFMDANGDGIGDLPGIIERLSHVASLGVDAIWISPFFTSPMKDMGYDVSDYRGVDPMFGALGDFDRLVARAHDLGLKVIIDQVLSHTSDRHPWFVQSRSSRGNARADWYVWADPKPDGSPPNNWPAVFGGPAWEYDPGRGQYYLHNFLIEQPDLNFHNPDVQDALLTDMRWWLERGVDGFRLDTVNFYHHDKELRDNPPAPERQPWMLPYDMQDHVYSKTRPENIAFLERMRALTDEFDDRALLGEVGEELRSIEVMGEYTAGDDRLHMAYSFAMLRSEYGASFFRRQIEGFRRLAPDGWPCWTFSNHDTARPVTRWGAHAGDPTLFAEQMLALLSVLPGTLCVYQGEELGLPDGALEYEDLTDPIGIRFWPHNRGRDGCRTPMPWEPHAPHAGFSPEGARPWLPVRAPHPAMSVAAQDGDPGSVLHRARAILAHRSQSDVLRGAAFQFLDAPEPVLAIQRGEGDGAVTAVFNLEAEPIALALEGGSVRQDAPLRGAQIVDGRLELAGNGYVFLSGVGAAALLRAREHASPEPA